MDVGFWSFCVDFLIFSFFKLFFFQAFCLLIVADKWHHIIFSDTICDLGGVNELANYGEYSGAPSEQQTYDYAKTILSLMTQEKHPEGSKNCSPKTMCVVKGSFIYIYIFS